MPDKALRLYPLPPRELRPSEIHKHLHIIPSNEYKDSSLPRVAINMVGSVDGRTSVGGKAAGIGSGIDRTVMRNLRAGSDAVMVGANTLRAEKMSLSLDEVAGGAQPLAVIVTTGGDAPLRNLILPDDQDLLLVVCEDAAVDHPGGVPPGTGVLRVPAGADGRPDLSAALRALKRDHDVRRLLVEGGPTLNRALVCDGLADELFLTVAPKLLGGPDAHNTILAGALQKPQNLGLLSVHLAGDELFLHYCATRAGTPGGANFA